MLKTNMAGFPPLWRQISGSYDQGLAPQLASARDRWGKLCRRKHRITSSGEVFPPSGQWGRPTERSPPATPLRGKRFPGWGGVWIVVPKRPRFSLCQVDRADSVLNVLLVLPLDSETPGSAWRPFLEHPAIQWPHFSSEIAQGFALPHQPKSTSLFSQVHPNPIPNHRLNGHGGAPRANPPWPL